MSNRQPTVQLQHTNSNRLQPHLISMMCPKPVDSTTSCLALSMLAALSVTSAATLHLMPCLSITSVIMPGQRKAKQAGRQIGRKGRQSVKFVLLCHLLYC